MDFFAGAEAALVRRIMSLAGFLGWFGHFQDIFQQCFDGMLAADSLITPSAA